MPLANGERVPVLDLPFRDGGRCLRLSNVRVGGSGAGPWHPSVRLARARCMTEGDILSRETGVERAEGPSRGYRGQSPLPGVQRAEPSGNIMEE